MTSSRDEFLIVYPYKQGMSVHFDSETKQYCVGATLFGACVFTKQKALKFFNDNKNNQPKDIVRNPDNPPSSKTSCGCNATDPGCNKGPHLNFNNWKLYNIRTRKTSVPFG